MTMKLFYKPRSRSVRPRWLLEELGVPYELVRLDGSDPGKHPALLDGEVSFAEPSAICLIHLADRFPEGHLAPPVGSPERGRYHQWLSFAEGTIEPLVMEFYRQAQLPEEARGFAETNRERLNEALDLVAGALEGRNHLVGERFTAADLLMSALLHLAYSLRLLEGHQRLERYVHEHTRRPACRRAVS